MDTGDTVTVCRFMSAIVSDTIGLTNVCSVRRCLYWYCCHGGNCCCIPDREDTASLGKAGLFLNTTDPLLED